MSEEEKNAIETTKILIEFAGDNYIPKQNREKLQILLKLIEKQQKEIDKLKSENQIFQRIKNGTTIIFKAKKKYIIEDKINKYYIGKDKIREKIEDLKETISRMDIEDIGRMLREEQILILEEILEENNNG